MAPEPVEGAVRCLGWLGLRAEGPNARDRLQGRLAAVGRPELRFAQPVVASLRVRWQVSALGASMSGWRLLGSRAPGRLNRLRAVAVRWAVGRCCRSPGRHHRLWGR